MELLFIFVLLILENVQAIKIDFKYLLFRWKLFNNRKKHKK